MTFQTEKPSPALVAKFLLNDLKGILSRKKFSFEDNPVPSDHLGYALRLMEDVHVERKDVRLWCMEVCDSETRARARVVQFLDDFEFKCRTGKWPDDAGENNE